MNNGFGQWLSIAIKTFKWNFDEEYYNRGKSGKSDLLINYSTTKRNEIRYVMSSDVI